MGFMCLVKSLILVIDCEIESCKTCSIYLYREETDSETRDSFSDSFSDESESEKLSRWDGCSSEEGVFEHESTPPFNDRLGNLYFQYFERSTPYGRVPLLDKVIVCL